MKWEKAIQLFVEYEATVLSDGKKTAVEKAQFRARGIEYLLAQMPNLASKEIEEITPQIWMDSLRAYKKSNRDYIKNWEQLIDRKKYKDLRACIVYARDDYTCRNCGVKDSDMNVRFTVDHKIPRSQDGGEDLDNLQCFCRQCNMAKFNNPEQFQEWMKRRAR
jgi:hypothetical protein